MTGGGRWTARYVVTVLRNPVYVGRFADGDTSRHGVHEAVVDTDVFETVRGLLASRRTTHRQRRQEGEEYILRQKIVCPRCGRFLTTYHSTKMDEKGNGLIYRYYACRSTADGRRRCKGVSYSAYEVELPVQNHLTCLDTWHDLLGSPAGEEEVRAAMTAWSVAPPRLRREILQQGIQGVEIGHRNSEIAVTFASEPWARFRPREGGFSDEPVNRPVADEQGRF